MDGERPKSLRDITLSFDSSKPNGRKASRTRKEDGSEEGPSQPSSSPPAQPWPRELDGRSAASNLSPAQVLKEIGATFTDKRKTDRVGAYKRLQEDLMNHAHQLVPFVVSLKEILGTTIDIEGFLKGSESNSGRSPLEETRDFLTQASSDGKDKRVN